MLVSLKSAAYLIVSFATATDLVSCAPTTSPKTTSTVKKYKAMSCADIGGKTLGSDDLCSPRAKTLVSYILDRCPATLADTNGYIIASGAHVCKMFGVDKFWDDGEPCYGHISEKQLAEFEPKCKAKEGISSAAIFASAPRPAAPVTIPKFGPCESLGGSKFQTTCSVNLQKAYDILYKNCPGVLADKDGIIRDFDLKQFGGDGDLIHPDAIAGLGKKCEAMAKNPTRPKLA